MSITSFQKLLIKHSIEKDREWFNNYLKGAIEYRGVKSPIVSQLLIQWVEENKFHLKSQAFQLNICNEFLSSAYAEDKFAGILYLQKFLSQKVHSDQLLKSFQKWFKDGCFFDWSTTDWFCVRVVDPLIQQCGNSVRLKIADWKSAKILWQRRTSIVAMRSSVKDIKNHALIKEIIQTLVIEKERFIQTGIGWVLAEMSKVHPSRAEKIFKTHIKNLSMEVLKRHSKHLKSHKKLLEMKKSLL